MAKNNSLKVKFGFKAKNVQDLPAVENFVNTSVGIPELVIGTPPITATALNLITLANAKNAEMIAAQVTYKNKQQELNDIMSKVGIVVGQMQNNAINYIGEDATKASLLNADLVPNNHKKSVTLPGLGGVKSVEMGTNKGDIKVKLHKGIPDATSYQIRYTIDYNQPGAVAVISPRVFTSMYNLVLSGFKAGQHIGIEVRGSNNNGEGPWSEVFEKTIY